MPHSIRVRVLNREFSLVVRHEDEERTRELAAYVDAKIREFRRAHPEQSEVTATIITAMAIADDLFVDRDRQAEIDAYVEEELGQMAEKLNEALAVNGKRK